MEIKLNSEIYPLEAILSACYVFIDRAYIFLDGDSKGGMVKVSLKGKRKLSEGKLGSLRGEFMNELLHCALRHKISKSNKKIREYIVGSALYSPLPEFMQIDSGSFKEDPLEIASTWEEKYGSKKKDANPKV